MPRTNGATAADAGTVAAVTSPSTGWASGDAHHRSRNLRRTARPEPARAMLRRAVQLASTSSTRHDANGPKVSEELIAEALHPYPDDLVVATKCGLIRRYPRASSTTSASRRTSSSGGGAITTSQTSWASTGWGGIINRRRCMFHG
jgi:hypothetical protein